MTRHLQKLIHVACRELGLDADARHDIQLAATGKESMRDMDAADLERLLERLKKDGFNASQTGQVSPKPRKPAPRADLRLVHVLWSKLGQAGALDRPGRGGLNAFVRARFEADWGAVPADIDMLADPRKIEAVIAALKDWGRRAGIDFDWTAGRRGVRR